MHKFMIISDLAVVDDDDTENAIRQAMNGTEQV